MTSLPTRRDEAWRYADLAAAERLWPPVAEDIMVPAGGALSRAMMLNAPGMVKWTLSLGAGARAG